MDPYVCNICGGEAETIYELPYQDLCIDMEDSLYVQKFCFCKKCGFLFVGNPFSEEQLSNRYKYLSKFEYDSEDYILDEADGYKKRCIRQLNFIRNSVENDFSSIIEIGSASGYNLSLYSDKETMGIEPSAKNCRLALKHYNVDMYNGMFQDYINDRNLKKYDLVFLSHVLEHIVNPYDFILECKSICNKYIFIEVPTMDNKFMDEPLGTFCDEHINYFTLESLTNLMFMAGFELIDVNFVFDICLPAGFPAMSTIWKIAEKTVSKPKVPVLDSETVIRAYIDKNVKGFEKIKKIIDDIPTSERLAVWGVGNCSAKLLANTSLGEKNIVRVYDNAEGKQEYTFHGVEICSFNENDIYNKEIDSILVATYTAQKAISRILDSYKEICKVYYLFDI